VLQPVGCAIETCVIEEHFSDWLLRARSWSVQRPNGQTRQRDEKAIRNWKARRWPELKKSRRDKAG
jgi:hypothetical protein